MLAACDGPILDIACGHGRNALYFAALGRDVIAADRNLRRLRLLFATGKARLINDHGEPVVVAKIHVLCCDFRVETWPFRPVMFGGAIMVDYYSLDILPYLAGSMKPGAALFIETPKGYGGNYLALPLRGSIRAALAERFELENYSERHAGPKLSENVSVIALARRK